VDLNDVWQEHKRWILGVLGAAVLFFVGLAVVSSVFDPMPIRNSALGVVSQTSKTELYSSAARSAAVEEKKDLAAAVADARKKTEFVPSADFDLTGKPGSLGVHYNNVTSQVRKHLNSEADRINVRMEARELGLPTNSPTDRDEIQRVLIGLELVKEALTRLFAAAERVRELQPEAIAVESVQKIQIPPRAARRPAPTAPGKQKQVEDYVDEVNVNVEFRCDAPTLSLFLESFRGSPRPILIDKLKVEEGKEAGDLLTASMTLVGLRLREE
jgi:hypothetical protein